MSNHFLSTIQHLRTHEEIMLYGQLLDISAEELEQTGHYLKQEYEQETISYPHTPPKFTAQAAVWAARLVFNAAQLVLYREQKTQELASLLSDYASDIDASAILSADLTLRFLPAILQQLKAIDPEDVLIETLEKQLHVWHYSGLSYVQETTVTEDFKIINDDPCLLQLYLDRIIENKHPHLAQHPQWNARIAACLGIHTDLFWKNFNTQNIAHGSN